MARRAPARKTGRREIEAAPEKMYRACLAEEAGAELLEHPVDIDQDLQEAPHRVWIVGRMLAVLRKPDRVRQFIGHLVDGDVNAKLGQISHHGGIEARDRLSGESKLPRCAIARRNPQGMVDEVEIDLKGPVAIGDRRGRQPARGDIQCDVPGMIEPWRALKTDLADNLGPQMQRIVGLAPRRGRQFRPCSM